MPACETVHWQEGTSPAPEAPLARVTVRDLGTTSPTSWAEVQFSAVEVQLSAADLWCRRPIARVPLRGVPIWHGGESFQALRCEGFGEVGRLPEPPRAKDVGMYMLAEGTVIALLPPRRARPVAAVPLEGLPQERARVH